MINDKNIISLGQNKVCPFLLSQGLLDSIVDSLSADKIITSVFKKSICSYERHDFSIKELPAMSVFIPDYEITSRNSQENGSIVIRMYFPNTLSRNKSMVALITMTRYVANFLQSPFAFELINDNLIELPQVEADNYEAIVDYKESKRSPLMEIFRDFKVRLPRVQSSNLSSELSTSYTIDMQNWMYFLDQIGIDYTDPNKILYPILNEISLYTEQEYPIVKDVNVLGFMYDSNNVEFNAISNNNSDIVVNSLTMGYE